MTSAGIIEAIRAKLQTVAPASIRVLWDNAPDDPTVANWWQCFIQVDSTSQVSMPPIYRMTGTAIVNVYAPAASGDKLINDQCDAILASFRGSAILSPDVQFRPAPSISGSAQRADGIASRTVRIPFRADFS